MRTLHTFKGGARLAGAMRLGEMAHRLETAIEHLAAGLDVIESIAIANHTAGRSVIFAGVTDTCGMAMMLARMPWNQASPAAGAASWS